MTIPAISSSCVWQGRRELKLEPLNQERDGAPRADRRALTRSTTKTLQTRTSRRSLKNPVRSCSPRLGPIVPFTGVISVTGHTTDPDAVDAAICAALAP
jgi:hypothetical protein